MFAKGEKLVLSFSRQSLTADTGHVCGFTLTELLVAISAVSLATAILLPALSGARRQARATACAGNQRQIVGAANFFAAEHDGTYPDSVATVGTMEVFWNWQEPMMLIGYRARSPRMHRSVSGYLRTYIADSGIVHCPSAPSRFKYLQQAWDAGDQWDNPETDPLLDPLSGTYCLCWDYTGYLQDENRLFFGPENSSGGRGRSNLLVCDYFGYDHHRSPKAYGCSEKFEGASVTHGSSLSSAYWSRPRAKCTERPSARINAGYVDGHVESHNSGEMLKMRVIWKPETGQPYPWGIGPGGFLLPADAGR